MKGEIHLFGNFFDRFINRDDEQDLGDQIYHGDHHDSEGTEMLRSQASAFFERARASRQDQSDVDLDLTSVYAEEDSVYEYRSSPRRRELYEFEQVRRARCDKRISMPDFATQLGCKLEDLCLYEEGFLDNFAFATQALEKLGLKRGIDPQSDAI